MRLVLIGRPGAGKGTQAAYLACRLGVPRIAPGEILRAAPELGSERGRDIAAIMQSGALVPDDLVLDIIKERITRPDCRSGVVFDGFPRTIAQAQAMELNEIQVDHVIELDVPHEEILKRLTGRRVHPASGRVYHTEYRPPRVRDIDDVTGEPLQTREDDEGATVRRRLAAYEAHTTPVVEFFRARAKSGRVKFSAIQGTGTMAEVTGRILASLEDP